VYRDEEGVMHTSKGSTSGIRRSLKEGLLGDLGVVRVCRTKTGVFEPLQALPEFRDLVSAETTPTPLRVKSPPTPTRRPSTPSVSVVPTPTPKTPPPAKSSPSVTTPPPPAEGAKAPHIRLHAARSQALEGVKLLLVALVAMAAGLAVFLFFSR
jgi:hypothetical protein